MYLSYFSKNKAIIILLSIMIAAGSLYGGGAFVFRNSSKVVKQSLESGVGIKNETFLDKKDKVDKIESKNLSSLTITQVDIAMKYNKASSEKYWKIFLNSKLSLNERREILLSLTGAGAGWGLYKEISDYIYQGISDDETTSELIHILTDAYEGGKFKDNASAIPQNNKDQVIQDILREQLNHPIGKNSLRVAMQLLYMVEGGGHTNILEESIQKNSHLLSEAEKLEYRLHYGFNDMNRLAEVIAELPISQNKLKQFNVVAEGINDTILMNRDNKKLRNELRTYLDSNPIEFDNFSSLNKNEQNEVSEAYGNWLWMYGATKGEDNLDNYIYQASISEKDPRKVLAIIDFQMDRTQYSDDSSEYDRLLNNSNIQTTLKQSLLMNEIDSYDKKRVKILLGISDAATEYKKNKTLEEQIASVSEEDKKKIKLKLIELLNDEKQSPEKKARIKNILEGSF